MRSVLALAMLMLVPVACGAFADKLDAAVSGKPQEHRFDNGVRCYTYTEGSISCVVVPK